MAKIQIKSEKVTPFGGIFSIMEQFDSTLSALRILMAIQTSFPSERHADEVRT